MRRIFVERYYPETIRKTCGFLFYYPDCETVCLNQLSAHQPSLATIMLNNQPLESTLSPYVFVAKRSRASHNVNERATDGGHASDSTGRGSCNCDLTNSGAGNAGHWNLTGGLTGGL